ncbi:MAG: hypothetical protein Q9166_004063 [cf. Caloplaca sp. 2 TL-2023]
MASLSDPGQQDLTSILQSNLDELRNLVACRICIRPMYEPYTTQCGHTFCYSCLRQWFERGNTKKTCPDCRAHIQHQPAPAFLVRNITQTFVNTAILLPAGETTEDHRNAQREEVELVEKDKSWSGLFNGRFKGLVPFHTPIRDASDGVERCPSCMWELEDGMCNSCGYTVLEHIPYMDDEQSVSSEAYSSLALEELLAEDPDHLGHDSDDNEHRRHVFGHHLRPRRGLPSTFSRLGRPHRVSNISSTETSDDDDLTDESGSSGSLRDFVADDMALDDVDADSDAQAMRPDLSTYDSGSEPLWDGIDQPSSPHLDHGSHTSFTSPAPRRFRRRRVPVFSPENDLSDSPHASRHTSQHREGSLVSGGFSPLQSNPDGGDSQDAPIQIDSDSDIGPVPPVRRRKKRPTALSISSHEEDSGSRGVNIPHSRSSRASSDGTARNNNHSSASRISSRSPPPPISVGSSPAGPSPSHDIRSPRLGARHRRTPSATLAEDSTYEHHVHDESSTSSRNTPTAQSAQEERIQNLRARMLEYSRALQPRSPLRPQSRSPNPSTRQSTNQHRQDRKRLRQQLRARQRQERASRGGLNRQDQPQQLAYIGG